MEHLRLIINITSVPSFAKRYKPMFGWWITEFLPFILFDFSLLAPIVLDVLGVPLAFSLLELIILGLNKLVLCFFIFDVFIGVWPRAGSMLWSFKVIYSYWLAKRFFGFFYHRHAGWQLLRMLRHLGLLGCFCRFRFEIGPVNCFLGSFSAIQKLLELLRQIYLAIMSCLTLSLCVDYLCKSERHKVEFKSLLHCL